MRKERITWTSLPKTFQDAIHFVRQINLRYLWIDSLCIVQDDQLDWELESHKMATIYRNAYLTIAATSSSGDSGGCYSSGSDLDKDYEVGTDMYVREKPAHFDSMQHHSISSPFPLLSRAWFYQERLLSPRVLHFGPKEILWECKESCSCQCQRINPKTSLKLVYEHYPVQKTVSDDSKTLPRRPLGTTSANSDERVTSPRVSQHRSDGGEPHAQRSVPIKTFPGFWRVPSRQPSTVLDLDRFLIELLSNYDPDDMHGSEEIKKHLTRLALLAKDQHRGSAPKAPFDSGIMGRHYDSSSKI